MYRLLIFLAFFFFNNVFCAQYQACTGFHINATYYNYKGNYEPVYKYSFDININLNKNFVDKNEITISNYTHWSFNEAVYYRNISSICASLGTFDDETTDYSCIQWIPSNNTFVQVLPFHGYKLFYYSQIDSNLEKDSFQFIFDKKFMAFQDNSRLGRLVENRCGNTSYGLSNYNDDITICCNNFINVTIPDTSESICLEYKTSASISLNSKNLLNFEAKYAVVPNVIKVAGNVFISSYYSDYYFKVNNDIDVKGCNKSSDDYSCYLNTTAQNGCSYNYAYNFLLSPLLYSYSPDYGIIVSKLRVINGIPLKENFEAFTKSDPCWKPQNSIPFSNSSIKADISFCCTLFGQQTTSVSPSSTKTTSFIPVIQTTDSANTLTCNLKNSFVFIVAFVLVFIM